MAFDGSTVCLDLPAQVAPLSAIRSAALQRVGLPHDLPVRFTAGGRPIEPASTDGDDENEDAPLIDCRATPLVTMHLCGGLQGGKGGFGANLRASGKSATKATLNFGACRDLSGRRLRSVNNELRLKKWLSDQEQSKRKELGEAYREGATPSGLPGWYLPVPTWAEGVKRKANGDIAPSLLDGGGGSGGGGGLERAAYNRRYKMDLCRDWVAARSGGRRPPPTAPLHWGCPKGPRCTFAHGEADLVGPAKAAAVSSRKEADRNAKEAAAEAYAGKIFLYAPQEGAGSGEGEEAYASAQDGSGGSGSRSMLTSVLQGLNGGSGSNSDQPSRKRPRQEGGGGGGGGGGGASSTSPLSFMPHPVDPAALPFSSSASVAANNNSSSSSSSSGSNSGWLVHLPWDPQQMREAQQAMREAQQASRDSDRRDGKRSAVAALDLPDYLQGDDDDSDDEDEGNTGVSSSSPSNGYESDEETNDAGEGEAFGADVSYRLVPSSSSSSSSSLVPTSSIAEVTGRGDFTTLAVAGMALPHRWPLASASDKDESAVRYHWEVKLTHLPPAAAPAGSSSDSSSSSGSGVAPSSSLSSSSSPPSSHVGVQLGWAQAGAFLQHLLTSSPPSSSSSSDQAQQGGTDGVGDTASSWAYDPGRQVIWHAEDNNTGDDAAVKWGDKAWSVGDVIGCTLECRPADVSAGGGKLIACVMSYTVNGSPLSSQPAFPSVLLPSFARLYPALSLEEGVRVEVNIGGEGSDCSGFAFPPPAAGGRVVSVHQAALEGGPLDARRLAAAAAAAPVQLQQMIAESSASNSSDAAAAVTSSSSSASFAPAVHGGGDSNAIDIDDNDEGSGEPAAPLSGSASLSMTDEQGELDLSIVASPYDLVPLGLERLKRELVDRGLKAGCVRTLWRERERESLDISIHRRTHRLCP